MRPTTLHTRQAKQKKLQDAKRAPAKDERSCVTCQFLRESSDYGKNCGPCRNGSKFRRKT